MIEYALIKDNNTIANVIVMEEFDESLMGNLLEIHEASYYVNLNDYGNPTYISDTWNPETNTWEVLEVIHPPAIDRSTLIGDRSTI